MLTIYDAGAKWSCVSEVFGRSVIVTHDDGEKEGLLPQNPTAGNEESAIRDIELSILVSVFVRRCAVSLSLQKATLVRATTRSDTAVRAVEVKFTSANVFGRETLVFGWWSG